MNARERVKAVFEGRTPDRVPWGEFAVDSDTVGRVLGRPTYYRAKAKSQIGRCAEVVESWRNVLMEVLQSGTPEEVRRAVRRTVEAGKRVGWFIFGSSHSVAVGTPQENCMAMDDGFAGVS